MKLSLNRSSTYSVRAYGPGQITLAIPERDRAGPSTDDAGTVLHGTEVVTTSLILSAEHIIADWPPQRWDEVREEHFEAVLALEPELILFGSGANLRLPPVALVRDVNARGIGLETMDTAAACRTFNILVAEGRHVVAALLMI
ncbi:MAG: hypothetical protein AMJ69_07050 [Gammaproteobacteria bacterium SG8_47]|nr:MAG: hypothetical protein AMJ69_07050 [Gammaproteobacteria bacterium SG8_47]